ncbi:MAG: cytochrome c oxidase accessory protein CcoG [Bacteroidota bacterium]
MNDRQPNTFRDHISTINEEGKRNWIFAKKPKGKLYQIRTILSVVYLVVFFSLPLIEWNDEPLFLFNVLERKFILLGVIFWPQDFFIFGLGMLTFILFVILFTVVYGRVFCGWACPQTIFMEMVFRKIEYWIDGDANAQKSLRKSAMTLEKLGKRSLKHVLFFGVSFLIANTFLAYIIGKDDLFRMIREPMNQHLGGLSVLILFTGAFYGVYAFFREQVCLIVCPYGRLQGVMLDRNSIVVAYDYVRGEDRAKFKKNEVRTGGDCIDCNQCVTVCPTGIDIRNGTQLECVNCTACIDACNFMMQSVGLEQGLIRLDSENGISSKQPWRFTKRILAYTAVLVLLIGVLVALLVTRKDIDATVMRTPGMLYQIQDSGYVSNLYNIKLINKTHHDIPIQIRLGLSKGEVRIVGKALLVNAASEATGTFFIMLPQSELSKRKTTLELELYSGDRKIKTLETSFLGPVK